MTRSNNGGGLAMAMDRVVAWLRSSYEGSTIRDMAHYGCASGYGPIYNQEIQEAYESMEEDLWEILCDTARDQGMSPLALLDRCGEGPVEAPSTLRERIVWTALESAAQAMPESCEDEDFPVVGEVGDSVIYWDMDPGEYVVTALPSDDPREEPEAYFTADYDDAYATALAMDTHGADQLRERRGEA